MRRIIFSLLVLGATLVSCQKQETPEIASQEFQTLDISFTAGGDYEMTRGYFDGGTVPETWEKDFKSMEVFVCQTGNIYLRRTLTSEELEAKKVTLSIPNSGMYPNWTQYPVTFYFFANYEAPADIDSSTALDALIDDLPVMYNSSGDAASPGPKWETGFTMVARHSLASNEVENRNVSLTLQRTVAKVAVKVSIDPDFSANHHGGQLEITGASVVRAASDCRIFLPGYNELPSSMDFTHWVGAVSSETDKEFVFYIFPNNSLTGYDPMNPAIVIDGVFDRDGNPATTDDLFDVRYEVFINESNRGQVRRNQIYKYDLKVVGLDGAQVESTFNIKDWLTPDTQEVEAGN